MDAQTISRPSRYIVMIDTEKSDEDGEPISIVHCTGITAPEAQRMVFALQLRGTHAWYQEYPGLK